MTRAGRLEALRIAANNSEGAEVEGVKVRRIDALIALEVFGRLSPEHQREWFWLEVGELLAVCNQTHTMALLSERLGGTLQPLHAKAAEE